MNPEGHRWCTAPNQGRIKKHTAAGFTYHFKLQSIPCSLVMNIAESCSCTLPNSSLARLKNLFDWHLRWLVRPAVQLTSVWWEQGFVVSSRCDFQRAQQPPASDTLHQTLPPLLLWLQKILIDRNILAHGIESVHRRWRKPRAWWSAGSTELLPSEQTWSPLDDAVTRVVSRAEQAASGHRAPLTHNWVGAGAGPRFCQHSGGFR